MLTQSPCSYHEPGIALSILHVLVTTFCCTEDLVKEKWHKPNVSSGPLYPVGLIVQITLSRISPYTSCHLRCLPASHQSPFWSSSTKDLHISKHPWWLRPAQWSFQDLLLPIGKPSAYSWARYISAPSKFFVERLIKPWKRLCWHTYTKEMEREWIPVNSRDGEKMVPQKAYYVLGTF